MFLENFHCHVVLSSSKLNFRFENQALLHTFLHSFCFPYQLMYINLNALISKPSSGLYYEEKKITTSTELLLKEFLASAVRLLQNECCPRGQVNGIFLVKACPVMILVHCAA